MNLLKELKDKDQDFEWYPTTEEIIEKLYSNIIEDYSGFSMLDIGAGNGKVFLTLEKINKKELNKINEKEFSCKNRNIQNFSFKKYAIEKSKILIDSMDKDIFIIGSDFYNQTLIDKEVDIIFCNPPYSDYATWAEKIIKEGNSKVIYLVIPCRWEDNVLIQKAIEKRNASTEILGTFSFINSEDRKARAEVNLVKIDISSAFKSSTYGECNPFNIWFDETFKINAIKSRYTLESSTSKIKKEKIAEVISKEKTIQNLVCLYQQDMQHLLNNYKSLEQLDSSLLKELGVEISSLKEGLHNKIKGLKNLYWSELFNLLHQITDRLAHSSRQKLLNKLLENTHVDFTEENIYSITIWAIKNSNEYFDSQLLEIYLGLSSRENITLYKSNHRLIEDGWRYNKSDMTHYSLDYRIVIHYYGAISFGYDSINGMGKRALEFIEDIFIIAKNLGFSTPSYEELYSRKWVAGKPQIFYYIKEGKELLFAEIKAFRNGNLHIKFSPEFMKKLNIEAARLNKWIKSAKEAVEEFDITEEEASLFFNSNLKLISTDIRLLT